MDAFTNHINSITPEIQFTVEEESEGKLPMLNVLVHRKQDGSLKTTIYRKPTHTNQYLDISSHHPLQHKLGVIRTLVYREDFGITEEEDKVQELNNIRSAFEHCRYR